jgi:hypothetical protein
MIVSRPGNLGGCPLAEERLGLAGDDAVHGGGRLGRCALGDHPAAF